MDHTAVIDELEALLPTIRETGDPEGVMLKHARAHDWAPAVLVKMAQLFNQAKTLTYMDRNPDNRGGSFPLIDTDSLLESYTRHATPAAAVKSAAAPAAALDSFPDVGLLASRMTAKEAEAPAPLVITLADLHREADMLKEAHYDFMSEAWAGARELVKMAAAGEIDPAGLMADLVYLGANDAAETVGRLTKWASPDPALVAKRAFDRGLRQDPARLDAISRCLDIADHADMAAAAHGCLAEQEFAIKEAATATKSKRDRVRPSSGGVPDGGGEDLGGDPVLEALTQIIPPIVGGGERALQKIRKPTAFGASDAKRLVRDTVSEWLPGADDRQRARDEAVADEEALTMLHRLMLTDPIISQADPAEVVSQFNTIRDTAPEFARDPNRLRMQLRESLAYGGTPLPALSELAQIEKTREQANSLQRERSDETYKIAPPGRSHRPKAEED